MKWRLLIQSCSTKEREEEEEKVSLTHFYDLQIGA